MAETANDADPLISGKGDQDESTKVWLIKCYEYRRESHFFKIIGAHPSKFEFDIFFIFKINF